MGNWVFNENPSDYTGILINFDAKKCDAVVMSLGDAIVSTEQMGGLCDRNLVYTGPEVLEVPIAIPVCGEIAGAISYWMYEAERRDIRYDDYQKKGMPPQVCPLSLFDQVVTADRRQLARGGNTANGGATVVVSGAENVDGNQKFSVADFALPFFLVFLCVAIATMVHL